MGNKAQRRKERHTKKRQEKRKKQAQSQSRQMELQRKAVVPIGSSLRLRQQMQLQSPQAWSGETVEDVAVFDDSVLSTLPEELSQQVALVRESLQDATESRGEKALKRLAVISRSSPLSEWRLFVRGLVDWLAGETETAQDAWNRLSPERRPGRIAEVMLLSLRSDLEQVSRPAGKQSASKQKAGSEAEPDAPLLYHAKLLRQIRFERAALRIARAGTQMPEEFEGFQLDFRKLEWLKEFVREYRETEPELTAALGETALARAFSQNYSDIFEAAVKAFPGPRHDRRNLALTFYYYSLFQNDRPAELRAEKALDEYLKHDLAKNESLSKPLRGAIASQIHLREATLLIRSADRGWMMAFLMSNQDDDRAIRKHLKAALKAYPGNQAAYKTYVEWLESQLDEGQMTQAERKPLETELSRVMQDWSRERPEDVEPRLWLVDYLLENEQMTEARPHVDFLAASRQDNPRVRATPWKWRLLEAMRLSRRKTWLAEVPAQLDEAEALWPVWLPRQWLSYLRAAWMLRSGQTAAFEIERQRICEVSGVARDSLGDACMMLGAAQRMRIPADLLKQFRVPVDQAVKNPAKIPLEDYFEVGGFFWDLHRAQLIYPAYRIHGRKFGQALFSSLAKAPRVITNRIHEEKVHKALLWGSEYQFWSYQYDRKSPDWLLLLVKQKHPVFVAAYVNAFFKQRHHWGVSEYEKLGPVLREAAGTQRDPYYRYWFAELAEKLENVAAQEEARYSQFPFGDIFRGRGEDDIEDYEDDDEFL